ncbi:MAG: 2-C-methyl-D-erythritol 4-phosphate cytidylyltransferase [Chlamydiales bacterium]|nr:2-C-methyl-D-erythritol 4-phosphate cytidylyltransferase [Chlamydiales bacterium]
MTTSLYPTSVILLAGGEGTRLPSQTPKQFLNLHDKPVALHSFDLFANSPHVLEIVVVCALPYRHLFPSLPSIQVHFALPGKRRQDSVYNGLLALSENPPIVCIHDSARPFLSNDAFEQLLEKAFLYKAAALAVPIKNTIKESDPNQFVQRTLDRSLLWEMHTPQAAAPHLLHKGFEIARAFDLDVTDDMALIELIGHPVKLVQDSPRNFKITTSQDWEIALHTPIESCPLTN